MWENGACLLLSPTIRRQGPCLLSLQPHRAHPRLSMEQEKANALQFSKYCVIYPAPEEGELEMTMTAPEGGSDMQKSHITNSAQCAPGKHLSLLLLPKAVTMGALTQHLASREPDPPSSPPLSLLSFTQVPLGRTEPLLVPESSVPLTPLASEPLLIDVPSACTWL